jgi:uncharacterized protein with HEPN domain
MAEDETLKNMENNIEYLKKLKKDVPEENKKFVGNIERSAEIVRSLYIIADTIKNVSQFFSEKFKKKDDQKEQYTQED